MLNGHTGGTWVPLRTLLIGRPTRRARLTNAQHRMLGRLVRGERLELHRFHGGTLMALKRKGCVAYEGRERRILRNLFWFATDFGRDTYARHGKRD